MLNESFPLYCLVYNTRQLQEMVFRFCFQNLVYALYGRSALMLDSHRSVWSQCSFEWRGYVLIAAGGDIGMLWV